MSDTAERPWREQVPASVLDAFTPEGDEVHASTDRRMLWHLEGWLAVRAINPAQHEKRLALYRYLCETCEHEWTFYGGDDLIPAHRQCLWCNTVDWS